MSRKLRKIGSCTNVETELTSNKFAYRDKGDFQEEKLLEILPDLPTVKYDSKGN